MADNQKQIRLAEMLQELLLQDFHTLLLSGGMSPTDRATLSRLLSQNGWSLDPSRLPTGLKDLLTTQVSFDDADEVAEETDQALGFLGSSGV